MVKYVTIPDIRRYPSYANVIARLLYLHVALSMDISSRTYAHSWRQLSAELDIPLQKIRTALAQLERDGLIATQKVTQQVTYGVTQKVTHKVTQIYILSVNDLDEPANEPANSPTNSQTNSQLNSQSNADKKNINIPISSSPTLTDARVDWLEKKEQLARVLHLGELEAAALVDQFRMRQQLKQKTWENDGDLVAHLIAWAEKRSGSSKAQAARSKKTDSQVRAEEITRTREEQNSKTEEDKEWEEVCKVYGWWQEAEKSKDKKHAADMLEAYKELRDNYEKKYQSHAS